MPPDSRPTPSTNVVADRRRTPRREVLGRIEVSVLSLPTPARVREVSLGGFSLETAEPVLAGTIHRLRFALENVTSFETVAECVHSTRLSLPGRETVHIAGFEFVPTGPVGALAVARLVDHVAALCAEPA